jgi:lysophospholipase L1-like esterase
MRHPALCVLTALLLAVAAVAAACTAETPARQAEDLTPLYVAIGASESVGTGARNPATESWVAQLHAKMPRGTRLANLGIGGLKTHQAVEQTLPVAVDLRPTIVTVWLAVNDFATSVPLESYRADLDLLLGTLHRETRARVYVANIPDLTLLPIFSGLPADALRAEVELWNAAIAETTAANGATLVDLFAGWEELRERPEYVSRDGLHPSTRGHRRIAEIFWSVMQGA